MPMAFSYDEILYPGDARSQTHPDRLATIAALHGMEAAPPDACRVLEIGCGDGSNLIPMAFWLPGSRFAGVDLAVRPIEEARGNASALGLGNIELHSADLREIGASFGQFDYVIAHGLYSWVPAEVRDRLLEVTARSLAPAGIAYISYNTYPGAHLKLMLREMMLHHARPAGGPAEQLERSRDLARFLAANLDESADLPQVLKRESERLLRRLPGYVFHDELSPFNQPVYFHEFTAHARQHGLDFLSEAILAEMLPPSPSAEAALNELGVPDELVAREQYYDFLRCRKFRCSLLCHANAPRQRSLRAGAVESLRIGCPAELSPADLNLKPGSVQSFQFHRGGKTVKFSTSSSVAKAVLGELGSRWPEGLAFEELAETVRARLDAAGFMGEGDQAPGPGALRQLALELFVNGIAELRVRWPAVALTASNRPVANALARHQLGSGFRCVNPFHVSIEIEGEEVRQLVLMLDGQHTREELRKAVSRQLGRDVPTEGIDQVLQQIARFALLVQ